MSSAVSALEGARFSGLAEVAEMGLHGMITLRGDLASAKIRTAAKAVAGADMPGRGEVRSAGDSGLCWMSPDELLVLCPYEDVPANLAKIEKTLAGDHALAVDVSDARAVFRVTGPKAREVMSKLCPVDLSPDAFKPGMFRRTRMAQVPAAFWMPDAETFQIICFRSVARYVFDLLKTAAQDGSEVGVF